MLNVRRNQKLLENVNITSILFRPMVSHRSFFYCFDIIINNIYLGFIAMEKFLKNSMLPKDVYANDFLVHITGKKSVFIENYKSILVYTKEKIIILCKDGKIGVYGEKLCIITMNCYAVKIEGLICKVEFGAGVK